MTGECYIHIFYPNRSKNLCTKRTLFRYGVKEKRYVWLQM